MPFPFQEALSFSDHLLAGGFAFLFAIAGACVCGGSVFSLLLKNRASESMDPRWDELALLCAKTTRALAAWAACPLGLGLWVVMMVQRPRMMEQLHSIFLVPALLGLLLFALGLCSSSRYVASLERSRRESRSQFTWGFISATGLWGAAAVLVSVFAFSVHTGEWVTKPVLANAVWNPTLPAALLTWVAVSILTFGAIGLLYASTRKDGAWRVAMVYELCKWLMPGAVIGVFGWIWWGISLPESGNRNLVLWLIAVAVAAQAVFGSMAYRWGVREPDKRHRRHAGAALVLVVLLLAVFGWAYVEAKGNFHIHQYMYRNGMIIDEAEDVNQTSLWKFVNLGEPLPAHEELGAFNFRAQCMACHSDWVKSQVSARIPRFRFEGDALRFLGEMRSKHPPYPLFAGVPEERRALAAYLEALITKSGRTLASRPELPPAEKKLVARPAMVLKSSPEEAVERSEYPESSKPEAMEKGGAVPVVPPPVAGQDTKREQEAKILEKEDRPIDSSALPAAAQGSEKSEEVDQVDSSDSPTRSSDSQGVETSKQEEAILITPSTPPGDAGDGAKALDTGKPEERGDVSPVSSSLPDNAHSGKNTQETGNPPEKESGVAPSHASSNDARDAEGERSPQTEVLKEQGGGSGISLDHSGNTNDAGTISLQKARLLEKPGSSEAESPATSNAALGAANSADGGSVSAAPSSPADDSRDEQKQDEKNSP